jgi:ABC-type branched-subunit amino acid transport system ATPase component
VTESVLATRGINKRFGSLVVASNVDLTLPAGARHALIGPNGAGKTTLINLMTGMLRPDAGAIFSAARILRHSHRNSACGLGSPAPFRSIRCFRT